MGVALSLCVRDGPGPPVQIDFHDARSWHRDASEKGVSGRRKKKPPERTAKDALPRLSLTQRLVSLVARMSSGAVSLVSSAVPLSSAWSFPSPWFSP